MNDHAEIAAGLRRLAKKAVNRAAMAGAMTELMPDDVALLKRAAAALEPEEGYLDRLRRDDPVAAEILGPVIGQLMPVDPRKQA